MSQAMYNRCYKNDKMQLQEKIPCIKGFLTSCVDQREITAKLILNSRVCFTQPTVASKTTM